jgi:hypothetical protein
VAVVTRYHAPISVDIDLFSDEVLDARWLGAFRGVASTVEEIRELCRRARADGRFFFTPCTDSDRCAGHRDGGER